MNESEIRKLIPSRIHMNRQASFNQTYQSQSEDKHEKFTFDKTLVQGIKQNNSSKIILNSEESNVPQGSELYDQQKQLHEIFVNTRKKFDQSKQTTNKLDSNIERLKKEKQILTAQKNKIQSTFTAEQKEFKKIQQQLESLNALCEAAQYQKDIRLQMGEVLRQDILFFKKNCFEANTKILRNHNKLNSLNGQLESTKKLSSNCRSLIYSIQKKITLNQTKRYEKLHSFHEVINKKMQNTMKKQQRQKMIEQSMLEALYGKMPEQQEQRKLLLTNLVLKKMLKTKMQREMEKFHLIESSFRNIQQNTTVRRVDEFVEKFIKRQQIYGELLESISKNEDKINILKQEKQQLEKEQHDVLYIKQTIEEKENQKKSLANKEVNMNIDVLRERLLRNEFLKNKAFSFASKFIAAFDAKNIADVKTTLQRQKPHLCLKSVLQKVKNVLELMEKEDSDKKLKEIYIESKNLTLPNNLKAKNIRIKTIAGGQENQILETQNNDMAYDDLSEIEYLNHNRKQIKRSAYLRNRMKTRAN